MRSATSAEQGPCQGAPPTIMQALRTPEASEPPIITAARTMEAPTITVVPTTTMEALSRVVALLMLTFWETRMVIPPTPTIMGMSHLMIALTMIVATMAALPTPSGDTTMVIPPTPTIMVALLIRHLMRAPTITVAITAALRTPSAAHTTMVIPPTPTIMVALLIRPLLRAPTIMVATMAALRTPSAAHTTTVDPHTTSMVATTPTIIVATRTQWGATTRCAVPTALTTFHRARAQITAAPRSGCPEKQEVSTASTS